MKFLIILMSVVATGCGQGDRGPAGLTGPQGNPGKGIVSITIPATVDECPAGNGGELIVFATDVRQLGYYDGSDPIQSFFSVCNGVNGAPGPATQLNLVQFCSGTPHYPSTFPEIGIKVGTTIIGVYSTNGGFLTTLPPGYYASNAVGSSCNFTINADGSISH